MPPEMQASQTSDRYLLEARRQHCRACGSMALEDVLDLGSTPLANRLLAEQQLDESEPSFPLVLAFCHDCALVQLTATVDPELLFRHYLYFSSFSDALLKHARQLAEWVIADRQLDSDSLVIEAASNDGYLLQYFHQAGMRVLGIEPARNIAVAARAKGIHTLNEFFGMPVAERLRALRCRADAFLANNVLAHVADLGGFVSGVQTVLAADGIAVFEVPYVRNLVEGCEFDTIYHEHLCYYSLTALQRLFTNHGMQVVDVQQIAIHGGSLRVSVAHQDTAIARPAVAAMLDTERQVGLDRVEYYRDFNQRVQELRQTLLEKLWQLKRSGVKIAAYGAAAKGATLLNCFGIDNQLLDFVVDRSTVKQGHYMPGVRLPIRDPASLVAERPDYVLLLTWNFADEILQQQQAYRQAGGQFLIPIPELKVA